MVTYSSTLAWEIRWTEEPGRLQSVGSQKSQTRLSDYTTTIYICCLNRDLKLSETGLNLLFETLTFLSPEVHIMLAKNVK